MKEIERLPWGGRKQKGRMRRRLKEAVFLFVLLLLALGARLYEIQIMTPPDRLTEISMPAHVLERIPVEGLKEFFSGE